VQINPSPKIPTASRWTATLASPQNLAGVVQIHGSAWMAPPSVDDTQHDLVSVRIANAASGGVHPWAVHQGNCGNDLGVYGPERAYPLLHVDHDGNASASVTLDVPAPKSGNYFVQIVASQANSGTIIACGNMAAPQS